ncbi:MAG TPA: hypothetical protein VHP30_09225, partial [Ignavibacteriales bacterium]|nr:hypothetical protein [Ignavibacteriales bacterium]
LAPEEVSKTVIPKIPLRLEMLKNEKVNAATLPEPFASSAVKSGAVVLDSTDKLGINPGVIVFAQAAIDKKEEAINAFYHAYNKAVEYLKTSEVSDYIDILIKETGFPEDVRDMLVLPEYTKAALPSQSIFEDVIDWLINKGLIKDVYSYEELIDSSFIG